MISEQYLPQMTIITNGYTWLLWAQDEQLIILTESEKCSSNTAVHPRRHQTATSISTSAHKLISTLTRHPMNTLLQLFYLVYDLWSFGLVGFGLFKVLLGGSKLTPAHHDTAKL